MLVSFFFLASLTMVFLAFISLETDYNTTRPLEYVTGLCLVLLLLIGAHSFTQAQTALQPGAIKHLLKEFRQDGTYQNLTHVSAGVSFRDEANPLTLNYLLATGKRPIVVRFREGEKIQVVQNYLLDRRVFVFSPPVTRHHLDVLSNTLGFDDSDMFIYSLISLARRKAGVTNERFDTTRFAHNDVRNLFQNVDFYKDKPSDVTASNDKYTRVSGELWRRRNEDKKEPSGEYPPRK